MNFLKGLREGFKDFGHLINNIINSLLLTVLYFIAIGPTSIILKIVKKRLLLLKKSENSATYWTDYNLKSEPEDNYYRQF